MTDADDTVRPDRDPPQLNADLAAHRRTLAVYLRQLASHTALNPRRR